MYDDAVELQQLFVSQRDKLCKDGERFVSPALVIIKRHLLQELDEERKLKAEAELKEDKSQVNEMSQASGMSWGKKLMILASIQSIRLVLFNHVVSHT